MDISDFIADGGRVPRYWYVTIGLAALVGMYLDSLQRRSATRRA